MSDASFDVWTTGAEASEFRKLLKVLTAMCAVFALSIITCLQATLSPSPSAQPDSEDEPQSKELEGSAAVLATFSRDNSHVYAMDLETSNLLDINLEKNAISTIDLAPSIDHKPIMSVGTSKSGDLLVATPKAAWSCDPAGAREPKPVWSRRVGFLDGIAFARDGQLFFGYRGDLWMGSIAYQEENDETP